MSTILLVDDDPDILKLISLRLTAAGHSVKGADSGEKALAVLAASRPELVITDLKMGGMDGLTLFDEIRKQAPTLPVIILTAHGTIPDAVAATRRGVFGFQSKPFDGKHLLDQVEQALRLSGLGPGQGEEDSPRASLTPTPPLANLPHQPRPLALQAKLLRVLQDREVRAVGATQGTTVDVRIISATPRDLDAQMKAGRFREDLYYRLNVVSLALPPLSERREDIVPLAVHYLGVTAARYGKDVQAMAPEALQMLLAAPWPGNVRQLVNVIEQAVSPLPSRGVPASLLQQALQEEPPQLPF